MMCVISLALLACSPENTALPNGTKLVETKTAASIAPGVASANSAIKLCDTLKKVAPEVQNMSPVGAQAQLVMAIASAFDVNGTALREVTEKIDLISSQSCPAERETLLSTLKMKTLQEAVR